MARLLQRTKEEGNAAFKEGRLDDALVSYLKVSSKREGVRVHIYIYVCMCARKKEIVGVGV